MTDEEIRNAFLAAGLALADEDGEATRLELLLAATVIALVKERDRTRLEPEEIKALEYLRDAWARGLDETGGADEDYAAIAVLSRLIEPA